MIDINLAKTLNGSSDGLTVQVNGVPVQHTPSDDISPTKPKPAGFTNKAVGGNEIPNAMTNGVEIMGGTFRKKSSKTRPNNSTDTTTNHIIEMIENEELFEEDFHCKELESLIRNYIRQVRRKEILKILDNKLFDAEENMEEVAKILNDFIVAKQYNNNQTNI